MPELKSAAPTFLVADVAATARWYIENLGFQASFFPKTPPYGFCCLCRDGVEIMLLGHAGYRKPETTGLRGEAGVWDAYVRIRGVRDYYDDVRARIRIQSELVQRPYGDWEFEVRDPNGYVLVFGE